MLPEELARIQELEQQLDDITLKDWAKACIRRHKK